MKSYWIKGKKFARHVSMAVMACLLLCGCQNMMNLADGQSVSVTGDTEVVSSTEGGKESGNGSEGNVGVEIGTIISSNAGNATGGGVLSFDDETVFRNVEDATGLAGILNEIVAKGQLYPVKAQEVQKNFTISAKTKNGNHAIYKVIIDGQNALRIGNSFYSYDARLDQFAPKDASTDEVISRLLSQSIQCDEPKEDMDYVILAEKLVYSFLDTLKTEEGKYQLEKYTPDYTTLEAKGYVGNGIEFCASVYFQTDIEDDASAFYSTNDVAFKLSERGVFKCRLSHTLKYQTS